jgi:hypothetical protein
MFRIFAALAILPIVTGSRANAQLQQSYRIPSLQQGQIVRVEPPAGMVVLRSSDGAVIREAASQLNTPPSFWTAGRQPLDNGFRYNGLAPGTSMWYVPGAGGNVEYFSEGRFYNPQLLFPK